MKTHKHINTIIAAVLSAVCLAALSGKAESGLQADFDKQGLSKLVYNNHDFLADGSFKVAKVFFTTHDGKVYEADLASKQDIRSDEANFVFEYPWGMVKIQPEIQSTRIVYSVTVENRHETDRLAGIYLELGKLRFPEKPEIENMSWLFYTKSNMGHNIGQPGIVAARSSAGTVAVCNEQIGEPLATGFGNPENNNKSVLPVLVYTSRHPMARERFPFIDRFIRPGNRDVFQLSLRFAANDEPLVETTADIYRKFARVYPFELEWPDRRPIGRAFLSSAGQNWKTNPRGWHHGFGAGKLDINSDAGKKEFAGDLLKYADRMVAIAGRNNAQGVIIWDIEGQEYPHPLSYLGDPRSLPPEMRLVIGEGDNAESVIDVFFRKITDAGLIPGICIRPQRPMRPAYDGKVRQVAWSDHRDRVSNVAEKIKFARDRWGCRLFYLDSDIEWTTDPVAIPDATGHSAGRDPALLREIRRRFPDVLVLPEWEDLQTYAYAAPYSQLNYNKLSAPPDHVLATYPEAFLVNNIDMKSGQENMESLIHAVRRGDILFYTAWYDAPENKLIQTIYNKSKQEGENM